MDTYKAPQEPAYALKPNTYKDTKTGEQVVAKGWEQEAEYADNVDRFQDLSATIKDAYADPLKDTYKDTEKDAYEDPLKDTYEDTEKGAYQMKEDAIPRTPLVQEGQGDVYGAEIASFRKLRHAILANVLAALSVRGACLGGEKGKKKEREKSYSARKKGKRAVVQERKGKEL